MNETPIAEAIQLVTDYGRPEAVYRCGYCHDLRVIDVAPDQFDAVRIRPCPRCTITTKLDPWN